MALRPDRKIGIGTEISFFMNETATRGIIVSHNTATTGVGAAMDDSNAVVRVPTGTGDGIPAGLLLNDVVNLDLTRQHINWHKDEVQLGGKVTILTNGWVVTDDIVTGQAPVAGSSAYMAASGEITVTGGTYQVGKFLSGKDTDGFAKVAINIPL